MCNRRLLLFLLEIGFLYQSKSLAFDRPLIESFGVRRVDDKVQLAYEPTKWPEKLGGFHIKRRVLSNGQKSDWVQLTKEPLIPQPIEKIVGSNLGLEGNEWKKFRQWALALSTTKKLPIPLFANTEYFEKLPGTEAGDLIMSMAFHVSRGKEDFRFFLLHGTGFIDGTAEKESEYEYGIFPVHEGGSVTTPAVTCKLLIDADPKEIKLATMECGRFDAESTDIDLKWKIPTRYSVKYGFDHCRVYRASAEVAALTFKKVLDVPGYSLDDADILTFSFTDGKRKGADASKSYIYKIVPVTYFKEELPVSWRVEYQPGEDEKQ